MWNWLLSKFSKLFSSGKDVQELPNVVASQQLPVTKTETPMPKVNAPAKTKVDKHSKPAKSKYKDTVQFQGVSNQIDNYADTVTTPYVAAAIIMSSSDSCSSSNYSSSDYSSSSSSSDSYSSSSSSSSSCD